MTEAVVEGHGCCGSACGCDCGTTDLRVLLSILCHLIHCFKNSKLCMTHCCLSVISALSRPGVDQLPIDCPLHTKPLLQQLYKDICVL